MEALLLGDGTIRILGLCASGYSAWLPGFMRRQCPVQRRTRLSGRSSRLFAWPPGGLGLVRVFVLPELLGLVSLGLVSLGLVGLFVPRGFQGLVRLRLVGVFVLPRLLA